MKMRLAILGLAVLCLTGNPAMADPGGPPGSALQDVLDGITISPVGDSSVDVTNDYLADTGPGVHDSYWQVTATGGSVSTLIIELASFAAQNKFGVFDSASGNSVQIFAGADAAGQQATLSITAAGDIYLNHVDTGVDFVGDSFGYYLDSSDNTGGGVWYSDTSMNSDGYDHMYAYQGNDSDKVEIDPWKNGTWTSNEWILAFEDLDGGLDGTGSDWDYTDFVVMVESVNPVPVPGAVLLGFLGLGAAGMKLRRFV